MSGAEHCGCRGADLHSLVQQWGTGGGLIDRLLQAQADRPAPALLSQQQQVGGCGLVVTPLHTYTHTHTHTSIIYAVHKSKKIKSLLGLMLGYNKIKIHIVLPRSQPNSRSCKVQGNITRAFKGRRIGMHVCTHTNTPTNKNKQTHTPPSPGEWCSPGSASDSRPSLWCSPHLCSPARGQRHIQSLTAFNVQCHQWPTERRELVHWLIKFR